jgi:membrane protease YdiL (CAAX protease family)
MAIRSRTFRLAGLDFDLRATVALVATTLLLTIDHYHHIGPRQTLVQVLQGTAVESTIYYLAIPLLLVRFAFGESPRRYGVTFGDWRTGLRLTAIILALTLPFVAWAARTPAMRDYYAGDQGRWSELIPPMAVSLIGWEFLFRGFLLFSLVDLMGPTAIIVQAVPFALAHLGKPEVETITTIAGGAVFGWVAWRTRSFLYPYLIHLGIYALTVAIAVALRV